jgi:tetratricopeptide (TPR) repeat protein
MNRDDVYELLDKAYDSEDVDEVADLVERALELEPDNPEALMFKADLLEDDEERLFVLERAMEEAKRYFLEEELSDEDILEDEIGLVYLGLLQRTAYTLFSLGEDERSLALVEELLGYDQADLAMGKILYYRILLEREEWARVLEATLQETTRNLAWAYARVIATFMLSDGKKDVKNGKNSKEAKNDKSLNRMLWDAVRMAPNVPFYMLGYLPDPIDETEDENFHFAILFEDIWSVSRNLLNWFSKGTILFGLSTGRFGQEAESMKEILGALDGSADYEDLTLRMRGVSDDEKVLEALTAGGYPS